jgi:hypothetical protein
VQVRNNDALSNEISVTEMLKSNNNWIGISVEQNNHKPRKIMQADVDYDVLWWARAKIGKNK